MLSLELQGWVTLRMSSSFAQTCTQSEHQWLDLAGFRDVVIWVDIEHISVGGGTLVLNFQTGASKDEALFTTITSVNLATAALGVQALSVHVDTASVPLARWLRWQTVSGSVSTRPDITFRAWASAARAGQSQH
jgi:hypothetical protein